MIKKLCPLLYLTNWFLILWTGGLQDINKRYFRIDQHLKRHFVNYGAGLQVPLPFYADKQLPLSAIQ